MIFDEVSLFFKVTVLEFVTLFGDDFRDWCLPLECLTGKEEEAWCATLFTGFLTTCDRSKIARA